MDTKDSCDKISRRFAYAVQVAKLIPLGSRFEGWLGDKFDNCVSPCTLIKRSLAGCHRIKHVQ